MSLIRSLFNDPFFDDPFFGGSSRRRGQDPFEQLWRQQQQLFQAVDQAFQQSQAAASGGQGGFPVLRTPPTHVTEENGQYVVEAELPGVRKEDLDVRVSEGGRTLTIEGHTFRRSPIAPRPQGTIEEHKEDGQTSGNNNKANEGTVATTGGKENKQVAQRNENGAVVQGEQTYQSTFSRSFTFPKPVDGSKIQAAFKDGLLTLRLPVQESARDVKVQIN